MGRQERPLNPDEDPIQSFAFALRCLRESAGRPGYRELSKRAHYSVTALADAAGGTALPSLPVALAYAQACGGDPRIWTAHWRAAAAAAAAVTATRTAPTRPGKSGESGKSAGPADPGEPADPADPAEFARPGGSAADRLRAHIVPAALAVATVLMWIFVAIKIIQRRRSGCRLERRTRASNRCRRPGATLGAK